MPAKLISWQFMASDGNQLPTNSKNISEVVDVLGFFLFFVLVSFGFLGMLLFRLGLRGTAWLIINSLFV